jgi:hypothetical protein
VQVRARQEGSLRAGRATWGNAGRGGGSRSLASVHLLETVECGCVETVGVRARAKQSTNECTGRFTIFFFLIKHGVICFL